MGKALHDLIKIIHIICTRYEKLCGH